MEPKSGAEKLDEILPVYFVLASANWMYVRNWAQSRFEDNEAWESFLSINGMTSDEFDRYEQFWISPSGRAVVQGLSERFSDSMLEVTSASVYDVLDNYLKNYATWDDFIREFADCTQEDIEIKDGEYSYFSEYAVVNGLCYEDSEDPEFDRELIVELIDRWILQSFWEAKGILLSAYDEIIKIV